MKNKKKVEERRKLTRSQRLARKFKLCLRCEWCNRWGVVPEKRWQKLYDDEKLFPCDYLHYCSRDWCKAERLECLPQ